MDIARKSGHADPDKNLKYSRDYHYFYLVTKEQQNIVFFVPDRRC